MKFLEIGVKHYINDIDNRKAFEEGSAISANERKSYDLDFTNKINKFPSEFKKNIFKSIDRRFFFVFLCSIVLNIGTLLILKDIFPIEVTSATINRIQEQYAKYLLSNGVPSSSYSVGNRGSDYKLDAQLLTGLNKWINNYTNNILESIKEIPALHDPSPAYIPKETRLPSKEELGMARKSATANRMASREELEKEVNSVGLLGIIASDTKSIDREYVQDLLEYASENSTHLTEVLAKLNSIEVPRYGSSGYLKKIRQSGSVDEFSDLKSGRTIVDNEIKEVITNVKPIETVETKPVKRNVQYEEVASGDLNKLANANMKVKIRSAQEVMRIVQSHTRALQDCYKQELRYDPGVGGKIVVRFTINTDGIVRDASIISSTLNSPRMEECILNRIKRWRNFPACDPAFGDKTYRQSFSFGEK